jgi:hypothetical protein
MKKYRVTESNTIFKEGVTIETKLGRNNVIDTDGDFFDFISEGELMEFLRMGMVEEIKKKKKEYTDDDLINLLEHFDGLQPLPAKISYETIIKKWKDEKHNK